LFSCVGIIFNIIVIGFIYFKLNRELESTEF
jgi:hypothetical protein